MDNLALYIMKVSAGTASLYLCYLIFFRNDTFFLRNRIFLLLNLFLPAIIPLLSVLNFASAGDPDLTINALQSIVVSGTTLNSAISDKVSSINFDRIFIWLYLPVATIFLVRIFLGLIQTYYIIGKGTMKEINSKRVVISDSNHPPFSFYPYVVLPRNIYETGEYKEVLNHESAHIAQLHSFDLLVSELFIAIQWFNPIVWMIKRSIVLNHEYLADEASIGNAVNFKDYQYKLLSIQTNLKCVPLAHNFSSLIKNRIAMINKTPTLNSANLKNIIILPVIAVLFIMFSFKTESVSQSNSNQEISFSKASKGEIFNLINMNIKYPQEAKASADSGRVYIIVKMGKGGVIKDTKAYVTKDKINVPILDECVITSYGNGKTEGNTPKSENVDHLLLQAECLRIANMLGDAKVPEWQVKDIEFALAFKFQLK